MPTIDLRFVYVFYELQALDRYIKSFEEQLPILVTQEREKASAEITEKEHDTDPDELDANRQELIELTDEILPGYFRSSVLVTLWAIFESAINDIAKEVKDQQDQPLGLNDIKGDLLERAKKYFNHVIKFPIKTDGEKWERLQMFKVLRNAIAHCNGRLENIKNQEVLKEIKKWEHDNIGINTSTVFGNLIFSKRFVRETYSTVYQTLDDLDVRVKKLYPNPIVSVIPNP